MQVKSNSKKYKIAVIGLGYVGLSNSLLLAQKNEVVGFDICKKRVNLLKAGISPLNDPEIINFLENKKLNFRPTSDIKVAIKDSQYAIIAIPTNYEDTINAFNTSPVEELIKNIFLLNKDIYIIIKSTIPIGFVDRMRKKFKTSSISFSPEFLREGQALHDNLFPTRIVIGDNSKNAKDFCNATISCSHKPDVPVIFSGTCEAEAIKLFSNTYLAMRVAFFNELDSYAYNKNLNTKSIIDGVSSDSRIGNYYNNPSFGYGGYCLPKDSKQLLSHYDDTPQSLISAVISSNITRKNFLLNVLLEKNYRLYSFYRLQMKLGSDNFRDSAIIDIIYGLINHNKKVMIYEPNLSNSHELFSYVENDWETFIDKSSIIVANRLSSKLSEYKKEIFSFDIFGKN